MVPSADLTATTGLRERVSAAARKDEEMSADEKGRLKETVKHIGGCGAGPRGLTLFEMLWMEFYSANRLKNINIVSVSPSYSKQHAFRKFRRKIPIKAVNSLSLLFSSMLLTHPCKRD